MTLAVQSRAGLRDAVVAALGTVRDPELDEPLTDLGFVAECEADDDGTVRVRLRLPTYFCAPNFAFLMVADADDAVRSVPGVVDSDVQLLDHFAAEPINAGVAARSGFVASFEGQATAELDELRRDFLVKALAAHSDRLCRPLLAGGRSCEELAGMTLGDASPGPQRDRMQERRAELGLPAGLDHPLLIDPDSGAATSPDEARTALARARLTRVNTEANAGICRGMLAHRYQTTGVEQTGIEQTGIEQRTDEDS